jgi:hypothetical protein
MLFWYRLGVISGSGKCSSITALNVVKYSKNFSILQFINLFGHFGMFILTFLHIDGTMNSSRANRYDSSTKMLSNQQNPTSLAEGPSIRRRPRTDATNQKTIIFGQNPCIEERRQTNPDIRRI